MDQSSTDIESNPIELPTLSNESPPPYVMPVPVHPTYTQRRTQRKSITERIRSSGFLTALVYVFVFLLIAFHIFQIVVGSIYLNDSACLAGKQNDPTHTPVYNIITGSFGLFISLVLLFHSFRTLYGYDDNHCRSFTVMVFYILYFGECIIFSWIILSTILSSDCDLITIWTIFVSGIIPTIIVGVSILVGLCVCTWNMLKCCW